MPPSKGAWDIVMPTLVNKSLKGVATISRPVAGGGRRREGEGEREGGREEKEEGEKEREGRQ